jgi:cyanophycin synthetase
LDTIDLASGTLFASLKKQGMTLRDIPDKGMRVELYVIENVPAGEISEINIDRTDEICASNANAAVEAARALNIDVAGIDIRCRDIGVPLDLSGGGILEVNALPDMIDHVHPFQGASRDVVKAYLHYLFKEGASDQ